MSGGGLIANEDDCLMQFATPQTKELCAVFDVAARIVVDGSIIFKADGMHMNMLTANKTMICQVFLPADCIDKYTFRAAEPIVCNINFKQLFEKLKNLTKDDLLVFQYTAISAQQSTLLLHLHKPSRTLSYKLALLLAEENWEDPPHVTYQLCVTMSSAEFKQTIRALATEADSFQVLASTATKPPCVYFIAKSANNDVMAKVPFEPAQVVPAEKPDKPAAAEKAVPTSITALFEPCDKRELFPTTVLQNVAVAAGCGPEVRIFLQKEWPLVLQYPVGTLGKIVFYISPLLESGEVTLAQVERGHLHHSSLLLAEKRDQPIVSAPRQLPAVLPDADDDAPPPSPKAKLHKVPKATNSKPPPKKRAKKASAVPAAARLRPVNELGDDDDNIDDAVEDEAEEAERVRRDVRCDDDLFA